MTDELYNAANNTIPLWAKDVWDCRLLIVSVGDWRDDDGRDMQSLGVMYGFKVRELMEDNKLVLSSVRKGMIGYINRFIRKDESIYAYGKLRGVVLEENMPNFKFMLGQGGMF